jgi:alpha-beta hydrolase superfamily lysophospholipase
MTPDLPAFRIATHTAADGYRWHYRHFPVRGSGPRARIVAIHGIQSHGGWYVDSCRHLADQGFEVFFLDRRGSGLNETARGDARSFRRLVADLAEFLRLQREQPGPLFLLAVSWGGKTALALQRIHPGLIDGLILLCPGLCPKVALPFRERLTIFWASLVNPTRLFPIPLSDPELFTASPARRTFLRDDPLALHQATARFLAASVRLDVYLRLAGPRLRVPLLLMLAGQDRIIDNDRTRAFVGRLDAPDREILEYPDAHHTLEFEPDPLPIWNDLVRWIERHLGAKPFLDGQGAST